MTGVQADRYTTRQPEGLRITLPAGPGELRHIGVASRFRVRGDFEITGTFELVDPLPPTSVSAVLLQFDFAGPGGAASIQRARRATEGEVYTTHRMVPAPATTTMPKSTSPPHRDRSKARHSRSKFPSDRRTAV